MNFDGRAVANFVLDYFDSQNRKITHLSLQKLVYFCHVWSLIELKQPLIKHQFEAWQFGPVLQYLYREFKDYKDGSITGRAKRINSQSGAIEVAPYTFDGATTHLLKKVLDFYGHLSAEELVELSHAVGSPWHKAWNHSGRINLGMRIDNQQIKDYYSKMRAPFTLQ